MYNTEQFENLFKKYYDAMYTMAYRMLRDEEESRDVVYEVFARVLEKGIVIQEDKQKQYLLSCVHNRCVNLINRKGHEEQLRKLYPHEQQLSLNPIHKLERWERIQDFMENDMPKETYEIIRLCFLEELSYKQAAEQKHMSVGYINKQIVYGLRLLRDKFNAQKKK